MIDTRWGGVLRKPAGLAVAALAAAALGSALTQVWAQQGPAGGDDPQLQRIIDRRLGEEEQIQRRLEWFYSTRTAGTSSNAERAALRLAAVRDTRLALERQRQARAAGRGTPDNFWVSVGPSPSTFGGWSFGNVAGRVSTIAADWTGGTLWLGTASGGVWKSTNDGASWTQKFDNAGTMTIGTIAVDPSDPDVIWVGTGENGRSCESYFGIGLLRSADGGESWEPRNGSGANTLENLASFANVIVDPRDSNHVITGGRIRGCEDGSSVDGGIYTTDDGGLSWTVRLPSVRVFEIAQDPSVLDIYWAATDAGIYKSTDNAVSWVKQTGSGLPTANISRAELAISPSDPNVVYALFSTGPAFWRTTDGGTSWTQMSSGSNACDGQCSYNMVLRVDRNDPDVVYRGTVHIFKSTNGGSNWSDLSNNWGSNQTVHQDTHHFLMHPTNANTFYVGCDGGIWKTNDGGGSFDNLNGNLNITQFYAVGVQAGDPGTVCGGAQDNSSLARTTDDVWDLQAVTGDGFVCGFNPQNPNIAYITSYPSGGYPNLWRSTTGPLGSFSDVSGPGSGINSGDRINWVTPWTIDPLAPDTLWLGTHRVYRSDNKGSNWTQVGPADLTGGSGSLKVIEVNRNFPATLFSGSSSGRVWHSADGGFNWAEITSGLPGRAINDVGADPTGTDRAFAVVGGFNTAHLWEWNAGSGWTERGAGLPNVPANTVLLLSDSDILVGTDTGIFRSADGGITFFPFMNGLPEGLVVTDLRYDPQQNIVTAGTYGRGAWQVTMGGVGPIVLYDSVLVPLTQIDGDGDGFVEPGETWSTHVVVRNGGGQPALGVQARVASAAGGVSILGGGQLDFGDLGPGDSATAAAPTTFIVEPTVPCDDPIVFDLVDVTTTNDPGDHADAPAAFTVIVGEGFEPPITTVHLEDDFDPAAQSGWTHEAVNATVPPCSGSIYFDEWGLASKDAAHGNSFHCGNGAGATYTKRSFSWLYYGGKDSEDGPGIDLPADVISATLLIEHWYDTVAGSDGGQVVIDANEDDLDVYTVLAPVGGYPGGTLATGNCNGLEGLEAFQGSSNGWVSDSFDLLPYAGKKVYLAFVFGSDTLPTGGEGWYVDDIVVQSQVEGDAICEIVEWPGRVPATATFDLVAPGTIEASWDEACNIAALPGQSYSIEAGDLDLLRATGSYGHAPVGGACDRFSPATFAPGAGNEYYLVLPHENGRQGGAGSDSSGGARPATSGICGERREAVCP